MRASELATRVEAALGLPALAGAAEPLRALVADAARLEALAGRPLRVALLGSTGAGKSTLLNALTGEALAEVGTERPTSHEAVAYAPEDTDLGPLDATVGRVARYRIRPGAPWSGQVLVDTPDLNSVVARNAEAAMDVLAEVDLALVVLHRGSVAEARPQALLRPFAHRRALLFVLNHADQLGAEARRTLSAQAAAVAMEQLGVAEPPPVFVVSAARRLGPGGPDDWEALLAALRRLAEAGVAAEVRGRNRAGVLAEIRTLVEAGLRGTRQLEEAVQGALDQGLARARSSLEADFAFRLTAARPQLRAALRRAAAERLSGPAAWGLRLSAWSGGGLVGGGLLARVHLPAGLLVAASGALLDEVQSRTRAGATRARMAATDDPLLGSEARGALAAAATTARARGVDPAALGLPDAVSWAEELAEVRAAAWRHIEGLDIERAAARWWRWARFLLRPLLELPLLALLADVAWRTVRAYLWGPLLEPRYYVNAAALALVWAAGGACLAGLSLAGVAAGVQRTGARRFAEGLDAAEGALRERVSRALDGPRAAAEAVAREAGAGSGPQPAAR